MYNEEWGLEKNEALCIIKNTQHPYILCEMKENILIYIIFY
jgi:hypothetical protein